MYIDTHCHINFKDFDEDRQTVITNAKKAGVKKFIIPGDNEWSSRRAIEICRKNPGTIFAAVGFHPYESQHVTPEEAVAFMTSALTQTATDAFPAIVAIGEIGLDYHVYKGEAAAGRKEVQKHLFESQLRFALTRGLPVIIHCRDAFCDLFAVLDCLPELPRGVIHCFTGGLQDLRLALDRHLHIGIDGNCTYSKQIQSVIPSIPLDRLLLETDSPYLTPEPHRGKRNEPKYIPLVAHRIADLHRTDVRTVGNQTTKNAIALFRLPINRDMMEKNGV